MASIGTLWTVPSQSSGKCIRAVAAIGGLKIDLPESYVHYEDNKKPEFLSKFPHGKIPAWEGKDGFLLSESTAIARYLAGLAPNSTLLGRSAQEAALVDQWVSFAQSELGVPATFIVYSLRGLLPYNKVAHQTMTDRLVRSWTTLNAHLADKTYLVGERLSLADLTVISVTQNAFAHSLDAAQRAKFRNLMRHYETVVNQPHLKEIFGETEYVDKALQYVPPPKEKKEAPRVEKAPPPKAEKKPKKEEEDEDDDILVQDEPKPKNPLDSLPKSNFNLEDWKRAYSNLDTRGPGGSLEWFYDKFDAEGFSIWRVDFRYNDELTLTFMSSNQIGGFFNRLEASRKYLFGSVGVLGESNNSVIAGVLVLRGKDYKPVVDVAPDWESYEYKKIDLGNAADKSFFEGALAWDLEVGGKKWVDGKNFK